MAFTLTPDGRSDKFLVLMACKAVDATFRRTGTRVDVTLGSDLVMGTGPLLEIGFA